MAGKALSEQVKRQKQRRLKEDKLREAVDAYRAEQLKPERSRRGLREIARIYGIPGQWSNIGKRYNGGRSTTEVHQEQQKLTPSEEETLVQFLDESADRGFPQTHQQLKHFADAILQSRLGTGTSESVGGSWSGRFLDRHRDVLQTHWSKSLDTQRASCMNPEAKKH